MILTWVGPNLALLLGYLLAVLGIAHMLRHRRSPSATIAWLLAFIFLPYVGVALYLLFGGRKLKQNRAGKADLPLPDKDALPADEANPIDRMLRRFGIPGASAGNTVTLCPTGVEGYQGLRRVIDEAEQTLFVQTFIFNSDEVGYDVLGRLTRKAEAGVTVRVLIDGLGSMKTPHRIFEPLVRAGGRFAVFKPVIHIPFRGRTNLRNHRKIAVADGRLALAGGMNITGEDMFPEARPGSWQDLSFTVEGPAVRSYEAIFRADWEFATGEQLPPTSGGGPEGRGDGVVQVVPSGPDVPLDALYAATITSAYRARRRLWVVTPYFIPDDALAQGLAIACRRGVDVRILLPEVSNHRLSDLARADFLREIEAAGGKILLYPDGMVHAKVMIADDEHAMVGSANMDMRSLFLNYEVMLLSYSPAEVGAVEAWVERLAKKCRVGVGEPGFLRSLAEGMIRTVSPLF